MEKNIQLTGLQRNTIDKYYTNENAVEMCITFVKEYLQIKNTDLVIEPSAGNGSFINAIKTICNNCLFYDIEPENTEIIKQDFLEFDNSVIKNKNLIHIIGNPPFGRQSSLAIKFIKKSCEFSDSISFILPKSFKKDSMKKKFHTNFHLLFEVDLPDKSFLINDKECDVPCIFQIWKKLDIERTDSLKQDPLNYTFVKKNEKPDISFRRVGGNAGNISKDVIDKSEQSHYFIIFNNNKTVDDNIENLKKNEFEKNNTVGPRSISKGELIKEFNKNL
jgi:predicted RNA methylase